ncbi:DNA polymerase III subunit gamma/tau [Senegalia massiliensis]|uniref:DNA polymerase III subunit gamma/tau n=1 Tax=Senegalia massiliensis TaxID=1720316 RepID=UPI0010327681|nr:DNA polymerase III subunit gamma/tau [Senegalia massiliensis]
MKNYAYETAYYDLCGIYYLIRLRDNKKFNQLPIHSIGRDSCLIIYQINKDLFNKQVSLDNNIKVIRHKIKQYNKKGKNEKIYKDIVDNSILQFGDDIDNIGLYVEDGFLVGSTIFHQYVYLDTDLLNSKSSEHSVFEFYKTIGSTIREFANIIYDLSTYKLRTLENTPILEYVDEQDYQMKDIHHSQLFNGGTKNNIIKTRLLIMLQEVTFCLWLQKATKFSSDENYLSKYIAVRLISIKTDEIMDNLKNIQKHLKDGFEIIDKKFNGELSNIIIEYDSELKKECQILRNFLHYDLNGSNFLDYIICKKEKEPNYEKNIVYKINKYTMKPLYIVLSQYFDIKQFKSMSDWQKIKNRIITILKNNFF